MRDQGKDRPHDERHEDQGRDAYERQEPATGWVLAIPQGAAEPRPEGPGRLGYRGARCGYSRG